MDPPPWPRERASLASDPARGEGTEAPRRGEGEEERFFIAPVGRFAASPYFFMPAGAMKKRGATSPSPGGGGSRASGARGGVKSLSKDGASSSRVHKPHLDEMHGPESLPYRPGRTTARKPSPDDTAPASGSKIFQPTDSRQSGPEFGPAPRSTGGAPGHRGGWKKRP